MPTTVRAATSSIGLERRPQVERVLPFNDGSAVTAQTVILAAGVS
ncbi:hypothetical protein ACFWOB_13825 [Streptomyces sp. NPDC058420]